MLVFAPAGMGEIGPGDDLASLILTAVAADPHGPLRPGDVVVVTSKIISKAAGLRRVAADRDDVVETETAATVARRGPVRIVRTRHGLTLAAAGVDNSNVTPGEVLVLPSDPDASADQLRRALEAAVGGAVGVVVSDTAGRAWRVGQTDLAIGAAGVTVLEDYNGRHDPYGNELRVTARAVADEIAAAADLVKQKVAGRPIAVVRGLEPLLSGSEQSATATGAAAAIRPVEQDMFARGTREAVLAAVLAATGQSAAYEQLVALEGAELIAAVLAGAGRHGPEAELIRAVLEAAEYPIG